MRILTIIGFASATLLAPIQAEASNNCSNMFANYDHKRIWECRVTLENETTAVDHVRCFLNYEAGFHWLTRASGEGTGRMVEFNCSNRGKTMTYRDYLLKDDLVPTKPPQTR